jgi:hypothetical protein
MIGQILSSVTGLATSLLDSKGQEKDEPAIPDKLTSVSRRVTNG